jgi:hypothetical protein
MITWLDLSNLVDSLSLSSPQGLHDGVQENFKIKIINFIFPCDQKMNPFFT